MQLSNEKNRRANKATSILSRYFHCNTVSKTNGLKSILSKVETAESECKWSNTVYRNLWLPSTFVWHRKAASVANDRPLNGPFCNWRLKRFDSMRGCDRQTLGNWMRSTFKRPSQPIHLSLFVYLAGRIFPSQSLPIKKPTAPQILNKYCIRDEAWAWQRNVRAAWLAAVLIAVTSDKWVMMNTVGPLTAGPNHYSKTAFNRERAEA